MPHGPPETDLKRNDQVPSLQFLDHDFYHRKGLVSLSMMYFLALVLLPYLHYLVYGLPLASTSTAGLDVTQISDGQVQVPVQAPMTSNSKTTMLGSIVLTFTTSGSTGGLITQTRTASVAAIKTLTGGAIVAELPTTITNSQGQVIISTASVFPAQSSTMNPEISAASAQSPAMQTSLRGAGTEPEDQLPSTFALGLSTTLAPSGAPQGSGSIGAAHPAAGQLPSPQVAATATLTSARDNSVGRGTQPGDAATAMTEPSNIPLNQPPVTPGQIQSLQLQQSPMLGSDGALSTMSGQVAQDSPQLLSFPTTGAASSLGSSAPQQSPMAPAGPSQTIGIPAAPTQPAAPVPAEASAQGAEPSVSQPSLITPSSAGFINSAAQEAPPAVAQSTANAAIQGPDQSPAISGVPGSMSSASDAEGFVTIQTTNSQGAAVPAIGYLTAGTSGGVLTDFVSFIDPSATDTDSAPTSTMTTSPLGLSIATATNSAWTTNTWITTVAPGSSQETVVPVLVGCPGCGGRLGSGLILWNLPRLPRVQFHIPGVPKLPRFHMPCIHIFGIHVGSCPQPSKLPDIITDSPEPGDPEPDEPEPSDTRPSNSNSDNEPTSTGTETATTSAPEPTSTVASSAASSSSSSPSCTNGITINGTAICNIPTFPGVIDHLVSRTGTLSFPTYSGELLSVTPRVATATAIPSVVPTADVAILATFSIWNTQSLLSSMMSTSAPVDSVVATSTKISTDLSPSSTSALPPEPTPTVIPPVNPP
ncbi:MAG: hypothetical protein Q9225_006985, partial [Loekoesia sp. 1 TL-2023]